MQTAEQSWKSIHQLTSAIPDTVDLADELIAERRMASEVAGMLREYKKSSPVSIDEMDQAIAIHVRTSVSD